MNAIQLESVQLCYDKLTVLHELNLQLQEGEVLGLFGHNGAGKTTTMKLILGLLKANRGHITVLGETPDQAREQGQLGYLPENVMFYPQLTGRETLRYFARLKRAGCKQADDLLAQVGLDHAADRRVKTYSKGMRQRLGLAQALLGTPRLLLMDEPTVGLDPIATQDLYQLVDQLRKRGTGIVLCSHALPGVESHIDRAAILAKGQLLAEGTLAELREQTNLSIRIRAMGMSSDTQWQALSQHEGIVVEPRNHDDIDFHVRPELKMRVLRELLKVHDLADIEILQPTLEELYRHYMDRLGPQEEHA